MSIIVVEGIDRVGKTTLVNAIRNWFEYDPYAYFRVFKHDGEMFNYDAMDNANETDKMYQLIEMAELCGGNVIFDRFHLSEFVYGICNRNYRFSQAYDNMLLIDSILEKYHSVLVYAKPTSLEWSSAQHGSSLYKHNMLMDAAFNDSTMKKISTDFNTICDETKCDSLLRDIRDLLTEV